MARRVHENQRCPSVMSVIDTVELSKGRLALITPLYTMPLSYMQVQDSIVVNMALCALATIKALSNKNICHGDLKPSNMMFQAGNRIVVTIDFGSCANYGESLPSTSPISGLDCPIEGSLQYDLTCLATSIVFLLGNKLDQISCLNQSVADKSSTRHTIHNCSTLLGPRCDSGYNLDQMSTAGGNDALRVELDCRPQ
jgi:serine/threonine protein kinase